MAWPAEQPALNLEPSSYLSIPIDIDLFEKGEEV